MHPLSKLMLVLPCLGTVLHGGDTFHYGGQVGLVKPMGDLKSRTGTGRIAPELGIWLSWPLSPSLALRPFLEYQRFPSVSKTTETVENKSHKITVLTSKWNSTSLGVDLAYHIKDQKINFLTGAALTAWRWNSDEHTTIINTNGTTRVIQINETPTNNGFSLSMGLGWEWTRHLATEVRMTYGSYRKQQAFNSAQLRLVYGF